MQDVYDTMNEKQQAVVHTLVSAALESSNVSDDDESIEHADDRTIKDVYESFSDEQKTVVNFMIGTALDELSGGPKKAVAHSTLSHADGPTVGSVFNAFSDEEKDVVYFMIGAAIEAAQEEGTASHSNDNNPEGTEMTHNIFEQDGLEHANDLPELSHSSMETIVDLAKKNGSYKDAFIEHAESLGYGIDDIDLLFPDAKALPGAIDVISRRTEWVKEVIDGAKHSPFARIKSLHFDLTAEEARAKGYVKGNLKKDEVVKLLKRVTTPTTVYKKQKLDRDDVVDITDLDVVAWLKWEMTFMLEEEIARAILIGDGREPDDEDKIDEDKLRPIAWDNEMYSHPLSLPAEISKEGLIESVLRARKYYKGTGRPTFFTTDEILTDMILLKDKVGRRLYMTEVELAAALRVDKIVVCEVMEESGGR